MSASTPPPASAFKDWFNRERYESIADGLVAACPQFDRNRFLRLTLDGLETRELLDRLRQTAVAADATLPGDYVQKLAVLKQVALANNHNFVGLWFSEFAGRFGTASPDLALAAMRLFTRYGSAEFAVRPYLLRDPEGTMRTMLDWTKDENEHVRRLACEGSRPRLPWGLRLGFLVQDPRPTRPILEALKSDPALYVRKSVANHLNDIAKDHPDYVIDIVRQWDQGDPHIAWIVRHGLRSLIKKGHPAALDLMGAGAAPEVLIKSFKATPPRLRLGERLAIELELNSTSAKTQTLIIDYVVHYVKASGESSPKVFKWKQIQLSAQAALALRKEQMIRNFSTRRHYPGEHRIELQINGLRLAQTAFRLD